MYKTAVTVTAALSSLLFTTVASAAKLHYEKVFTQITDPDNRLILMIGNQGEAYLHRPGFMTYAGAYRWQLDSIAIDQLWSSLDTQSWQQVDNALLQRELSQRAKAQTSAASDSDVTHLSWARDDAREHRLEIQGVAGWLKLEPHHRDLVTVAQAEEQIWQLMEQLLRQEVQ